MTELRQLLRVSGILPDAQRDALAPKTGQTHLDPWRLRAEGLDRALTDTELAIVLGHIARHRGFRSNAKREAGANANDDTSKMKKAINETRNKLAGYRTVGALFAQHPEYRDRKHNRGVNFDRSILRGDHEDEIRTLFAAQRRLGNAAATGALETEYARIAFSQRPLQDSEHMVGACQFEAGEKCAARRSYAFEMFRLLSRLAAIRLTTRGQDRPLTAEEIALASADFGKQKKLSWKGLRKTLDLAPGIRFAGIADKDEGNDFVARSGNAAEGTDTLRKLLGDAGWRVLMHNPVMRDRIAEVLTFREDPERIRIGLVEAGAEPPILDALMHGVETGAFGQFTKAGHISAKAARKLIPALAQGKVYSAACEDVGYNHAAQAEVKLEDVRNPTARKAVTEYLKQVRAMIQAYGMPDFIHIELARDIGIGSEERDKITKGIEDRNKQRDKLRAELAELLGQQPNLDDMIRYELWKEQNGFCLYTGDPIPFDVFAARDNRLQVDHILPWHRFGDDSFWNKTLCFAQANQAKKGRTPFEWFTEEGLDWDLFTERVERCKEMRGRKKGAFYLRKNAKEVEDTFRERNLNDTRYATRLLLGLLKQRYPGVEVRARPGQLTAKLRRAWGLDDLKKDAKGNRLDDDRHHALDAIVVAATTQSMLQRLTSAAQEAIRLGKWRGFDFDGLPPPALGFREVVRDVVENVFVSRAERHRARGEAHAATIKQVREVDGAPVVFERKAVEKLTLADLALIPVPAPYGRIGDPGKLRDELVETLRAWIVAGKPKTDPPLSPKGDAIRKVRVATKDKVAVTVRGGTADRGDMARVDVFAKADKRGKRQYHVVPIYPHQVADRDSYPTPPNLAVVAFKAEEEWTRVDGSFTFQFSLYQNSLIEMTKPDGVVVSGYFKGMDRQGAQIHVASHRSTRELTRGTGSKTLLESRKFAVDRLGTKSVVENEVRTWHGEACI
jgi:CRISPR-associated endonuclease Csn1